MDYISLKELCDELSISIATGRNWIKLGKLTPEYTKKNSPYFAKDYVASLKREIQTGKNSALKSRRNKKYISGNAFYHSYVSESSKNLSVLQKILEHIEENEIELSMDIIQYIVADCALHLFAQKLQFDWQGQASLLLKYLRRKISLPKYGSLIDALILDKKNSIQFCKEHPDLFSQDYVYEPGEDILGLIYISCKNLGNRKATGSYYTPIPIVKKLIAKLQIDSSKKILDPCCGTGNFLLQLPETTCFDNIYGNDIDSISVKITRLNMALKFPDVAIKAIRQHITELNYLTEYHKKNFHYIIGNPPWGFEFSDEIKEELRKKYKATSGKSIESFDIFLERALSNLATQGQLSFILPEAVLNVKAHTDIRELILQKSSIRYVEYLGDIFDGVQCPSIILQIANTGAPFSTIGMSVNTGTQTFQINTERSVSANYFSFTTTDAEYATLQKIKHRDNISFLAGNADFALGIVTGNNKHYISSQKTPENEMVLKGVDISKYHINPGENYITFQPEKFQQTAPAKLYRASEKLLYRFICNQLVFAYDDKQTLSLNSCNIVIPKLKNINIKYVLALLNSRVAQFIYQKEFHSVKVLRSHIESIPIPLVDDATQTDIIRITDLLIQGQVYEKAAGLYEELDEMIFNLFNLTDSEKNVIKSAVDGENKLLLPLR